MRGKFFSAAMAGAFICLVAFMAQEVDARGGRGGGGFGGGGRGGGSMSMGRGGSFGGGGYSGRDRSGGSGFSRGGSYSRPSGSYSRPKSATGPSARTDTDFGQRPAVGASQRPGVEAGQRSGGDASQLPAGGVWRPLGGGGAGGAGRPGGVGGARPGQLPGRGDINIDNDWGGDWDGWGDYPLGAGIVIGAVAGWTAAAVGSAYYALPPGCSPYADSYYGYSYYHCGEAWYQPQYEGDTIVYVNVPNPSNRRAPPKPKDTSLEFRKAPGT